MKMEEMSVYAAGVPDQKYWYRVGSIAAIVLAIGYIIIFPLFASIGAAPSGGEAWFTYLPGETTLWWSILALSVVPDFLYVLCFAKILSGSQMTCV